MSRLAFVSGGLVAALAATGLQAAEEKPAPRTVDRPLWELGLGAGVLQLPHYRGSDQSHTWLLPVPYIVYRGKIFKADRDGARALLLDAERFELDLSASASAPTRSRDNRAREGMPDLKPTVEIGPNLNWTLGRGRDWKLDLRLPVRAAITVGSQPRLAGWISTPNLNLDLRQGPWHIGLLGGPVFGDRRLHSYFYEVAPAYATAQRPAYAAPGGYGGSTLLAAVSQRDGQRWLGGFIKFDQLSGARFADSPLVRQHSQWSVGVAVSWVLARSDQRVSVNEE